LTNSISINMYGWCFALINNRLAEIYFNEKAVFGYTYVSSNENLAKKEQRWIHADIEKFRFTYRRHVFKNKFTG